MSVYSYFKEGHCTECQLNLTACMCPEIKSLENKTHVTFVVHIQERILSSNTARLAHRMLKKSDFFYRGEWKKPLSQDSLLKEGHTPLYLFPDDDAVEITDSFIERITQPIQLIVPDGRWKQTKKTYRRLPILAGVQKVKLPKELLRPSQYRLRAEPQDDFVCTFEAVNIALYALEKDEKLKSEMERAFTIMVERSLWIRGLLPKDKLTYPLPPGARRDLILKSPVNHKT